MDELMAKMTSMDPGITLLYALVLLVSIYVVVKSAVWWLIFGTGRLIFRKYCLYEWLVYTGMGLLGYIVLLVFNLYAFMSYVPEGNLGTILVMIASPFAFRVLVREVFSLCGLFRGDWNPFDPELRFMAWDESYLFGLLFSRSKGKRRSPTPWGSYADQESAYWYQSQYNRQNGYPY